MFRKLLPRNDVFFDFFEKHIAISCQAAAYLLHFVEPEQALEEIFQKIKTFENQADSIIHQCVEALHKTFITPMDRLDIYRLITTLDDITDEIQDIAKLIFLYKIEKLRPDAVLLAQIVIAAVKEVQAAISELRKMRMTDTIQTHFFTINHLENEADAIFNRALELLFEKEDDTKALIKWKEIYEHLEHATDVCEDVANIIEGIILENE
jgi:predicted phosphate transport protein (TIGR00153 family)